MTITKKFLTPNKYSRPQLKLEKVTKIAVHYIGNPNTSALANWNYFEGLKSQKAANDKTTNRFVSSHYIVGLEGEVIQCIPTTEWSYCTNQANGYSISIETCHPDTSGKFNEVTEQSLAELCAYLCKEFGLDPQKDIIRHYDVTGKQCPLYYVPTKYQSEEVANARWNGFKNKVAGLMKGTTTPTTATKPMYYVQVGAFTSKKGAEAYLKEVQKTYKDAFIKTIPSE